MSEEAFRIVVTIAVLFASLSMVLQVVIVFGIHRTAKRTQERVDSLSDRAEPLLETVRSLLDETRPKINDLTDRAVEISVMARSQVQRIDELLNEVSANARLQLERIDSAVSETVEKVHQTTDAVQTTILRPVREVNGIVAGLRAALATLTRGSRASVDHATQDEEMFI